MSLQIEMSAMNRVSTAHLALFADRCGAVDPVTRVSLQVYPVYGATGPEAPGADVA